MTRLGVLAVLLAALLSGRAAAAPLDRVRAAGVVACGGVAAPGLAYPETDGAWHGLYVDLCRAVATAVLGSPDRIRFRPYAHDADFAQSDDIAFLSLGDMVAHDRLDALLPGPAIFYRTIGLMVPADSAARDAAGLGDGGICVEPGSIADRALDAYFPAHHLALHLMPFQEAEEMADAMADGRCAAVADEASALAGFGDGAPFRLLPDVLAAAPVLAASPIADGRWAAVISWTVATLLRAEANGAAPAADAPMAGLPIVAASLGLADGWQARVVTAVGDYGTIFRRNLGSVRGPNALSSAGGLLVAPATE